MTRDDVVHIAQCAHSLAGCVDKGTGTHRAFNLDEFDRYIDRLLWAIRASNNFPRFDDGRFREACHGANIADLFKED